MILKLLLSYGRWVFGVHPAFFHVDSPLTEGDALIIFFGVVVDVMVVVGIAFAAWYHWQCKKNK